MLVEARVNTQPTVERATFGEQDSLLSFCSRFNSVKRRAI